MPLSLAIFSPDCPIVSPVEGSAIAGVTGMRSFGRRRAIVLSRAGNDFAFDARTSVSANPCEWSIGILERDSEPPAIATSRWPSAIWSAASVIAWFAEEHALLTLKAWTLFGKRGS